MDISKSMNMLSLSSKINSKDSKFITIKGLESFIVNFNKKSLIHIYGGLGTGKTTFAKDIVYKNQDKSFVYIDTYYNIKNLPDNCFLFRTSKESDILSLIYSMEIDDCDCIILDAYSNILSNTESWNVQTYKVMEEALMNIYNACVNKNCTLILINTKNTNEQAFNRTDYLRLNSSCEILLNKYNFEDNEIEIIPIKSRCVDEIVTVKLEERGD